MISILNFIRLSTLFLLFLPLLAFRRERAIFSFLRLAGPSFIKLGQILSVRSDLVGEKLAATLSSFQDNLTPFPESRVRKALRQEFGESYSDIFVEFDFNAVASASIAQVHKAKLVSGKSVAVKILRPNIDKVMKRDIKTIWLLTKIIFIFSRFLSKSFSDVTDLLKETAKSELDLLQEAANGSRLKEDLKNVEGFFVPAIFWKYSTSKILVLEWVEGISFSDKKRILESSIDKRKVAENFVISYFNQVYGNGFFHADMHPGNLFLMNNGDVGVVDFGIMGRIDKKTRLAVAEILISFLNKDYQRVAQIHVDVGLVPEDTDIEGLALSCRRIGETVVGSSVKDVSLAKLLGNLIIMTRDYKMVTRPELLLLQKTILLVEGVGIMLNPKLNIWDLARPWVKEWAQENIGFDAKIRDVLVDCIGLFKKFLRNN